MQGFSTYVFNIVIAFAAMDRRLLKTVGRVVICKELVECGVDGE